MLSSILAVILLSANTLAFANERRQATDAVEFTSAAEQLISQYIPSSVLPALESSVSAAASSAHVAGEPLSLIYDALLAISLPGWFASAVPSEWSTQFAALESGVNALRPTSAGQTVPVVIAITTTNSDGSTFTTSVTTTPSETGTIATSTVTSGITTTTGATASGTTVQAGSVYSSLTTEVIGGVTTVFETAVTGAKSVASVASGGISTGISGASSVASVASGGVSTGVSRASSVASVASGGISTGISGASSVATQVSGIISKATSAAGAAVPTAVSGAAAGVMGMVGLMIVL